MTEPVENGDDDEPKIERRRSWNPPTWLLSGLFTVCVAVVGVGLAMWSNDSVQDTNINYALKQIDKLEAENRALRTELGTQKLNQENFTSEVLDLMRRLAEQDRFRKQR